MIRKFFYLIFGVLFCITGTYAQTPGLIFRPSGATSTVLDPNQDKFTSNSTIGFTTNDILQSEIPYFFVPVAFSEPTSDLRRGSDCGVTDIVPDADTKGFYIYFDGTNLLFRLRAGGFSPGAFGYCMLIDTNQKFGKTGPNADPNYQAQTTGTNGNPGFEIELVWEKNFRLAVYNVDGGSSPSFVTSFPEATHTQSSKNLSTQCNDPDFFMDFYVPITALGITANQKIRIVATTSMSPSPAIGGTKSDIYGVDDRLFPVVEDAWTRIANSQPPFTPNQIGSGGSGIDPLCSAPPVVSTPIATGATSVSGIWTSTSGIATATITVFKNGVSVGTTTASGGVWTISGLSPLAKNDVVYAKSQSLGESQCLQSESVFVSNCTSANIPAAPVLSCTSNKGLQGTKVTNTTININHLTFAGINQDADVIKYTTNLTYPTTTSWEWQSTNFQTLSTACNFGGANDVSSGSYYVTAISTISGCESKISNILCEDMATVTVTPTITETFLNNLTTTVTGTCVSGARVRLYINGYLISAQTAASTSFSFSGLNLKTSDIVEVSAQASGQCMSAFVSRTTSCVVSTPIITTGADGFIANGSQIRGTSSEAAGATVTIYNGATSAVIGTTSVQTGGIWILTSPTAASGTTYFARQSIGCGISTASATVSVLASNTSCPVITAPLETATSVSGTVTAVAN